MSDHVFEKPMFSSASKIQITLVAVTYFVLVFFDSFLIREAQNVSSVSLASGFLLAVLLNCNPRHWHYFILACIPSSIAADLLSGSSFAVSLGFLIGNILDVVVIGAALRFIIGFHFSLTNIKSGLVLILVIAPLAPISGAIVGAATLQLAYELPFVNGFKSWWFSGLVGHLLFTPWILSLFKIDFTKRNLKKGLEFSGLCLVSAYIGYILFEQAQEGMLLLAFVPVIWGAFRFGVIGSTTSICIIAFLAILMTIFHHGPLWLESQAMTVSIFNLQLFLAEFAIPGLLLGILFQQNQRQLSEIQNHAESLAEKVEQKTEALSLSESKYRDIFENLPVPLILFDSSQMKTHDFNELSKKLLCYNAEALQEIKFIDLFSQQSRSRFLSTIDKLIQTQNPQSGEFIIETKFKDKLHVQLSLSLVENKHQVFVLAAISDRTDNWLSHRISKLRHQMSELVYEGDIDKIITLALDESEEITDSKMGFFHFVDPDQKNLKLQSWSTQTLKDYCLINGHKAHYPISKAGVWAECVHKGEPVIHNDYSSLGHKKGVPKGHPAIKRELTVPVIRSGRAVAVAGIGNKLANYTKRDQMAFQQISDLVFDYVERTKNEKAIEYMAYYDSLTDLPNRKLFYTRIVEEMSVHRRIDRKLAICLMDLDGFKPVNDQYGHHIGDEVLISFANRMRDSLRAGDLAARLGGDEFVLMLTNLESKEEGMDALNRIAAQLNNPYQINQIELLVPASIGVTFYPDDNSNEEDLIKHADLCMYLSKKSQNKSITAYVDDASIHDTEFI